MELTAVDIRSTSDFIILSLELVFGLIGEASFSKLLHIIFLSTSVAFFLFFTMSKISELLSAWTMLTVDCRLTHLSTPSTGDPFPSLSGKSPIWKHQQPYVQYLVILFNDLISLLLIFLGHFVPIRGIKRWSYLIVELDHTFHVFVFSEKISRHALFGLKIEK